MLKPICSRHLLPCHFYLTDNQRAVTGHADQERGHLADQERGHLADQERGHHADQERGHLADQERGAPC